MTVADLLRGLRAPYPDHGSGFWGKQTSTLNFCEEDYALSFYCAELCNTVTNGLFLWLGVSGIRNCIQESHANIFLLAYLGYIVVGLGSILFHATLKYPMQLVDELSMIYTTCLMMYASFSYSRSRAFSTLLGVSLLSLAGSITAYYHITKDPVFHQVVYAALTATVVFRSIWVMERQVRPVLQGRDAAQSRRQMKTMWVLVATGEKDPWMAPRQWLIRVRDMEPGQHLLQPAQEVAAGSGLALGRFARGACVVASDDRTSSCGPGCYSPSLWCGKSSEVVRRRSAHEPGQGVSGRARLLQASRRIAPDLAMQLHTVVREGLVFMGGGVGILTAGPAPAHSISSSATWGRPCQGCPGKPSDIPAQELPPELRRSSHPTSPKPRAREANTFPSATKGCGTAYRSAGIPPEAATLPVMSIPNEALHKLAREIEAQAAVAQQQIGLARTQMTSKQREQRLVRLTLSELAGLSDDAVVYEGVGKMFSSVPLPDLRHKLEGQTKELESDVTKLNQRLLYLETTHKNSREHIEQMLRGR
ncbi:hypothetical protein Purlil1_8050 [Purpureocillium lilacinum]|uniref:Uncharacterized protein n=2 Tax=Purpureocillium lilacinum TaxID=33203 RepID=A0ABR0BUG2_PURLI|nr:hypothetical protein Purlil1_8050 [Purpureocillium lilacinum]